jgi:hypothetical protein
MNGLAMTQAINKAEAGSRKLIITFRSSATVEDIEFLCGIERTGIFKIDNKTVKKQLAQIINSGKWNEDNNRTFFIVLGPSFKLEWLTKSRLADAIEKVEAIS